MFTLELYAVAKLLEAGPQIGVVDGADRRVAAPDLVGVERLPFAVWHLRQIGDDGMDMGLRVERAARVVLEQRIDQIAGLDRDLAALHILATLGEILLDPCHRLLDGSHVGREHAFVAGDIGHEGHRLRRREGEIHAVAAVFHLGDALA
ncbi:hypothetical protein D9M73_101530 [compost metagenome]